MRLLIPVLFCAVCAAALHASADVTPEEWTHSLLPGAKINPYVNKSSGCGIISAWMCLEKIGKPAPLADVRKLFEGFEGPPYSMLDVLAVLELCGAKGRALKFAEKSEIFKAGLSNAILYLEDGNGKVGHFSFCFRGDDGKLWISDPVFGNECVEFSKASAQYKVFSGIALLVEN